MKPLECTIAPSQLAPVERAPSERSSLSGTTEPLSSPASSSPTLATAKVACALVTPVRSPQSLRFALKLAHGVPLPYQFSVLRGPFPAGQYLGFWIQAGGCTSANGNYWYSFQSSSGNPNVNADAKNHTGWAYMSDLGSIVMGFEDGYNLGDKDYNDVMFTISSSNPLDLDSVPRYSGGLLQNCRAGVIAQVDYVEYKCFQYAVLSNPAGTSCSSFLSLPSGWTVMNTSDSTLADVLRDVGTTWDQSVSDFGCLVVMNSSSPVQGYGYDVYGQPCALNTQSTNLLVPFGTGSTCFATPCGSRMLIRGQRVGSCSGVSSAYCNPSSGNTLVDTFPIVKQPGQNVFPTAFNVYTVPGAATITLTPATFVPNPTAGSLDTDIYLLLDTSNNKGSNDLNLLSLNLVNFVNEITSSTFGFAPPNVGFGTIRYSAGSPSFTSHCAFNVDIPSVRTCISGVSMTSVTTTTQVRVTEGIDAAITSLNQQSAWRSYAYKLIVVITDSNPFVNGTDGLSRRMLDGNVVPVLYMPNPAVIANVNNFRAVLARLPHSGLLFGPTQNNQVKSNRLDQWFSTSQVPTLLRTTILNVTLARSYTTPDTVRDGFLQAVQGSYSLIGASPEYGQVNRNFTVGFPTGYDAQSLPSVPFKIPINVMGWGVTGVNVYANRKPIVNNLAVDTDENVPVNFDLPVSDPDNNLVRVMFLTRSDSASPNGNITLRTGEVVALNTWYNTSQFTFSPKQYWNGGLTFTYRASDGCELSLATSTVTVTVRPVNQAPEADDFVVLVDENSSVDIDFTSRIRDIDDATSTLSLTVLTVPTSSRGYLWDVIGAGNTNSRLNTGNFVLGTRRQIRFIPAQYVSGNATFTYRVTDPGLLASTTRTVTVVVANLRWPPVLSAPYTQLQAPDGSSTSVVVTITDPDFADTESVGLRITARGNTASWGSHSVSIDAGGSSALTASNPGSFPSDWATLSAISTSAGRAINITWSAVGQRGSADPTFTVVAFDSDAKTSNSLTFTLVVSGNRPPYVVLQPGTVVGSEDTAISLIQLSGSDLDDSQWNNLTLIITAAPSHGTLTFATETTVAGSRGVTLAAGTPYLFGQYASGSFAGPPRRSRFSVSYTPTSNFNGVDKFSYSFIDSGDATAIPDDVLLTLSPTNDPPQTSNITVYTDMEVAVVINEFSGFDIDTGDVLSVEVTSLPDNGALSFSGLPVTVASLPLNLTSWAITYTPPFEGYSDSAPYTTFKFRVCDNSGQSNRCSGESFVNVWVRFVNSPPTASDVLVRTTRNVAASFTLPAVDRNLNKDPQEVLEARVTSIGAGGDRTRNQGEFYRDSQMTQLVNVGDIIPFPRTLYFKPATDAFSYPAGTAIATLKFQARDHEPLYSDESVVSAVVDFVNQPPQFVGSTTITGEEDVPLQIVLLQRDWIVDDLLDERLIRDGGAVFAAIGSAPARGTLSVCFAAGNCTAIDSSMTFPISIPDEFGRVVYTPEPDTFGNNYTSFMVNFTDSGRPFGPARWATYQITINVSPVPDAPVANAVNFIPLGDNDGNVMSEDNALVMTWRLHDKDSLPSVLRTSIKFSRFSRAAWVAYDCFYDSNVANATCEQGDEIGNSESGFRNLLVPELTNSTSCVSRGVGYPFTDFSGCWAQFSIYFVPAAGVYSIPFIQWTFIPRDDVPVEGDPLVSILSVLPQNDPPTITAPVQIAPSAGVKVMKIKDDAGNSVQVADPDVRNTAQVQEKLIIEIANFAGKFVPAAGRASAACYVVAEDEKWECIDTLKNINTWINDSAIEIYSDEGFTEVRVKWTIDDLGNISPEGRPNPLNASATTLFVFTKLPAITDIPPPNNNLTIIVAAVAAAALILLGLLVWRLRKSFKQPDGEYFEVAVGSVAVAPVNPLYKSQFTDRNNPLYKA